MRSLTLVLAATLLATSFAAPAEAARRHKKKKTSCCAAKAACCQDSGYRAAEWGSRWYHTDSSCKALAQVPKEKLVTDLPATYGRRKHHCCATCK